MSKLISTILSIILLLFTQSGCKNTKTTMLNENPARCFIVGEGGGFAGSYIQYKICSDGLISMYDFETKEYKEIGSADPKKLEAIFNQLDQLGLEELDISNPGNMSQYISLIYDNKADHTLTWPLNSKGVNPELIRFFHECFSYCNSFEID